MVKEKRDGESPLYYAMSAKKKKIYGIFLNETKNKQHENEIPTPKKHITTENYVT